MLIFYSFIGKYYIKALYWRATFHSKSPVIFHCFFPLFLFGIFICFLFAVNIGLCEPADDELIDLKLIPSINEVVHFENDSYIVSCQANETRLRWFDPNNVWIENNRGRVHIEQRENELSLIFTSIQHDDNGNWTCEAEKGNRKLAFSMIVYSEC